MPKPRTEDGGKNLIGDRLKEVRNEVKLSQRCLSYQLQLMGYDIDKNVITRIEQNKRYVTDLELRAFTDLLNTSYGYLIEGALPKEKYPGKKKPPVMSTKEAKKALEKKQAEQSVKEEEV